MKTKPERQNMISRSDLVPNTSLNFAELVKPLPRVKSKQQVIKKRRVKELMLDYMEKQGTHSMTIAKL